VCGFHHHIAGLKFHAGYVSDRSIELERSMSSCYASRLSSGGVAARSIAGSASDGLNPPMALPSGHGWALPILESQEPLYTRAFTIVRLAAT
jgi:hypothetical protein